MAYPYPPTAAEVNALKLDHLIVPGKRKDPTCEWISSGELVKRLAALGVAVSSGALVGGYCTARGFPKKKGYETRHRFEVNPEEANSYDWPTTKPVNLWCVRFVVPSA